MFIRRRTYDDLKSVLDMVYHVITNTTDTYRIIDVKYDDVDCESGIVVGIGNPNYELIKELAKKGDE